MAKKVKLKVGAIKTKVVKEKPAKVITTDPLIGLELGGYKIIKVEDTSINGKLVKKLSLCNGTTQTLSDELILELVK